MTDKDIQQLTDRYLAGATTPAEECQLALALRQRGKLSEEWQAVSLMLGELAAGEAEYDAIMAGRRARPSAVVIALRIMLTTAAVYLVGLFLWLQQEPAEPVRLADRQQPVQEAIIPCTEGTPDEIIMCYLEQRENRPNTYSLIRHSLYEDKQ
ncbi:MAG: hypothetical protein K6B13_10855 [Prevotella sp.]|nr:hypothetical protein [Prevotella sp.]